MVPPRKYDRIVQAILRWKKDEFKFAKITDELVAEETRLKVRDFVSSKNSMQVNQLNINSTTRKPFTKVNCWNCGKAGHVQRNC